MTIRTILIDDEKKSRNNLRHLLGLYCPSVEVIAEAASVTAALSLIAELKPDILFLDIELGELSGFDLLKLLSGYPFEVIFVTAFDKYGIQAVKACAIDYLLKPINLMELSAAVEKAVEQVLSKKKNDRLMELIANIDRKGDEQKIAIALTNKIEFVAINTIIRLQAEGSYTHFYLEGDKHHLVCKTLKDYQDVLEGHNFIRTHQSHLVNLRKVSAYVKSEGGYISMEDGTQIPISRQRKEEVLSMIIK